MFESLKSRRSVRSFTDKEVEAAKLDIILKSALLSPTSMNKHCWEFIVVTDKEMLKSLSTCKAQGSAFLADAAVGIVVIGDAELSDAWVEDASIASTNILNVTHSLGLGACWAQFRNRFNGEVSSEDAIRKLLGIPAKYGVQCIIGIGYPKEVPAAYNEADLLYDKLHDGKFGSKYSI